MSHLEAIGISGGDGLREALTNCSDPLGAIEEFQNENGILLPSLRPALPFLDLHGVRRLEFHESILEEIRDKLISVTTDLANGTQPDKTKKLEDLLAKSFPVIKDKSVRPVVMNILKHLPVIKEEYLTQILDDKELYLESATEVKRQIWQDNQALFGDEVSPLLQQYISEKENALLCHEHNAATFFLPTPKTRRQSDVVQRLVHMIGKNVKLYDMVLQFLRTLFLRTRNTHYCTLRAELLMAIHDLEVNEICSVDPCHKFTWCVDACIRERIVNTNRSRELQGFLDGIKKGQEFVLGDLSMILCDPFALNTIAQSAMKVLLYCVGSETLPRENSDLLLLVRMMSLGLGSWDMIDSQQFREPKLLAHMFTKFMPCLVGMVVDDQIRAVSGKLEESSLPIQPPSELYTIYVKMSPLASLLALYYTLHVTRHKDRMAVSQILPSLVHCENDRAFDDTFMHALVSHLIHMADDFGNDDFCSVLFDDFLLVGLSKENVMRHLLRLLWHTHHRLPPTRLENLLETIHPNNEHSNAVHQTFSQLTEKIATYNPSPVAQPEKLDSPLMSVPAPTPAHIPDRL